MNKIKLFAVVAVVTLFASCEQNICIKCTPIVNPSSDEQTLCSRNKTERSAFQVNWIGKQYNCIQE